MIGLFFVVIGLMYFFVLRGHVGNPSPVYGDKVSTAAGEPFESSHERAPYALVLSIDTFQKLNVSKELAEFGAPDMRYINGKYYIIFQPGISLYMYPFYLVGKQFNLAQLAAFASISLLAFASCLMLFKIARNIFGYPVWASLLIPLIYAFGTTSLNYAITVYQHIPGVFLILTAFYAVWKYRKNGKYSSIYGVLVWSAFGLGIYLDFPNVFLMAPVMLYFLVSSIKISEKKESFAVSFRTSFLVTMLSFIIIIGSYGYYNYLSFGDWKNFGQGAIRYEGEEKFKLQAAALGKERTVDLTPKKSPLSVFNEERIVNGLYTLTLADDKGIFFFSPVLLLGVLGILRKLKTLTAEDKTLIAIVLINMVMYASFGDPWGGWAFGPRYLIPSMSVLSLYVLNFVIKSRFEFPAKILTIILLAFSAFVAFLGVVTTNTIPPKVEAVPLHLKYNFLSNIDFLNKGTTGNFAYNQYFRTSVSLYQYLIMLVASVIFLAFLSLFILPLFSEKTK